MNRPWSIAGGFFFALFCAGLVWLNLITPLWGDDYVYRFVFDALYYYDDSFCRLVGSWKDIWDSQCAHYLCTNGRFVAHTLAQGFLFAGQGLPWALANTLCLVASVWLLLRFAIRRPEPEPRRRWQQFLLTLTLYWLLMPHNGQLFFWLTGSCNYQWAALLVLAFLNLWLLPVPRWLAWLLYPVAFLAGNSNEALSLGLAVSLVGFAAWRHRALRLRQFAGLACFLLGTASNVFSPGVAARIEMAGESVSSADLWTRCLNAVSDISKALEDCPHLLLVPLAALLIGFLPWGRSRRRSCLLPAAVLSLCLAIYVRMIDPRATFGFFLYSFMLGVPVVLHLFGRLPRSLRLACGALLVAMVGMDFHRASQDIPRYEAYEQAIVQEARQGNCHIVPASPAPYGLHNHSSYLVSNSSGIHNRALAAYYGVPRFGVLRGKELRQLRSVPRQAYEMLRQPGEYCHAGDNVILVRLPSEPTSCLVKGYSSPNAKHAWPRCWGGFSTALEEQGGAWYLLIFYSAKARASALPELRLRLIEGHAWHWLSLDPRRQRGVLTMM